MAELTVTRLTSWFDKSIGLLNAEKAHPVLFKTRFGIHTFGMKFPIDVLILDNLEKVVSMKENLKPNGIFLWSLRYDTVIELPAGLIKETRLKIGEKVILHYT